MIVALHTNLPRNVIMWFIGILAFLQAGLQLFMFMHITEGENGKVNVANIIYSIIIALVVVYGTIWVIHY